MIGHLYKYIGKGQKRISVSAAILLTVLLCFPFLSGAQTGRAESDRQQIVLGEQVQLRLSLADVPQGYDIVSFFGWDTSRGNQVEVLDKLKMDTVNLNGQSTYIQDWKITSFDSGRWALPISAAVVQNRQTGEKTEIKIDPVYLNVLPVDISNMKDYYDIKDILAVRYFNPFWIIVGAIALIVLVVLAFLIWAIIRHKKKKPVIRKKIEGSPLNWALSEIEKLQSEKASMYIYFGKLNEIIRTYLHEKANLPTYYETSDELIMRMREQYNSDTVADSFYQNLKMMDAVKFAKYIPSENAKMQKTNEVVEALKLFDKKVNVSSIK